MKDMNKKRKRKSKRKLGTNIIKRKIERKKLIYRNERHGN